MMANKPLAYEAYQELADAYAAAIDTKPHNAFYDRPAMLSLLPDIAGKHVLDVGCGPGAYAEELLARGASVVACDVSERMLELAMERLRGIAPSGQLAFRHLDLTQPLSMFGDEEFDVVNAPLCFDYVADWTSLFHELYRILRPSGVFLFSCGHPAFDAEYFKTDAYFSVERVQCTWTGFGKQILMPSYRRSLEEILMPVIETGFRMERIHEPKPTEDFKSADPVRYERLMHRPGFICVRTRKPD